MQQINALIQELLNTADGVTPTMFFWLNVVVWSLLLIFGFWLLGFFKIIMMIIASVMILSAVYHYQNPPIKDNSFVFITPIVALVYSFIFHSGILFKDDLITDKSQLSIIHETVPAEYEYVKIGGGKYSQTHHYFVIGDVKLHCSDDSHDECQEAYAYKDKMATVLYADGLLYDMEVDGKKIYEFKEQLAKFQQDRKEEIEDFITLMILFGIPSLVLFLLSKRVIRDIEKIEEEDKKEKTKTPLNIRFKKKHHDNDEESTDGNITNIKNNKETASSAMPIKSMNKRVETENVLLKKKGINQKFREKQLKEARIKSRVAGGGRAWQILFVGLMILTLLLMILLSSSTNILTIIVFVCLMVFFVYLFRIPNQKAKQEVEAYYAILEDNPDANLEDYGLTGIHHYIGVMGWIGLYVVSPIALLLSSFMLTYIHNGSIDVAIFVGVIVLVLLGMCYFIIKRAKNIRDWALE